LSLAGADANAGTAADTTHAHLSMRIGGTTAGSLYDQVSVTGTVDITNSRLEGSLVGGYVPQNPDVSLNGDRFFLIIKDGTDPVSGMFANTPAGSLIVDSTTFNFDHTITFGGQEFAVSYDANWTGNPNTSTFHGGNDVALYAIP